MAISRTYLSTFNNSGLGSTTALTSGTFNSTGYKYLAVVFKWEGGDTTITVNDNKGSGDYTNLDKANHANGDLSASGAYQLIGTPGTGHTVTINFASARSWIFAAVYGIAVDTTMSLDVQDKNTGTGTAVDAGTLATTAATVSMQMTGGYTGLSVTPGSGWTEDIDSDNNQAQSRADASGTLDPACTLSVSSAWASVAASFKEGSGGGGGTNPKGVFGLPFDGPFRRAVY